MKGALLGPATSLWHASALLHMLVHAKPSMTSRPAQVPAAFDFFDFLPPGCGSEAYLQLSIPAWHMDSAMVGY